MQLLLALAVVLALQVQEITAVVMELIQLFQPLHQQAAAAVALKEMMAIMAKTAVLAAVQVEVRVVQVLLLVQE
jgi:hypothetical protein